MTTSSSQPNRVMIVDDHTMVRRGLATMLKVLDDLQPVGEAESGEAAIQLCAEVIPDVILMDLSLPGMDGAVATRAVRQQFPQVREGDCADELTQAIRSAYAGRATLSPHVAQALVETANQPPSPRA